MQSDRLLVAARKALAVGDAVQASRLAAQAKALAVQYGLHEDNPARVETTIQKYVELTQRAGSKDGEVYRRRYADLLMAQAEALLAWKEFDAAERLTDDAQRLSVTYGPFDAKPEDLLKRLATARRRGGHFRDGAVAPAGVEASVGGSVTEPEAAATVSPRQRAQQSATPSQVAREPRGAAERAFYDASRDTTRNVPVAANSAPTTTADSSANLLRLPATAEGSAQQVSGESAVEDSSPATDSKAQATEEAPAEQVPARVEPCAGSLLNKAANDQQVALRKVVAELAAQRSEARRIQETDPKRALEILQQSRTLVEKSELDQTRRDQLLRSTDRAIADVQQYIETNRPRIELDERNKSVKNEIDREQQVKVEVQEKLAYLVDDFNKKMDEQRWAEAEVVAKKAEELSPDEPVVKQLRMQALYVRRLANSKQIQSDKENGFVEALNSVEAASTPMDDRNPIQWGDVKQWEKLSNSPWRRKFEGRARRSEKEIEIEQRLKTPVSLKFQDAPLGEVMDHLAKLASVNVHLDPRTGGRGHDHRYAGDDRPGRADLVEECPEFDPGALAPELRREKRSAQHHQRAIARRRGLPRHLQRRRSGHADTEFRSQR